VRAFAYLTIVIVHSIYGLDYYYTIHNTYKNLRKIKHIHSLFHRTNQLHSCRYTTRLINYIITFYSRVKIKINTRNIYIYIYIHIILYILLYRQFSLVDHKTRNVISERFFFNIKCVHVTICIYCRLSGAL
jgi:4-hydroxybenzoate polyprenyltransferase